MNIDDRFDKGRFDPNGDDRFDARLRTHYAQAADALSPRIRAQLQLRRQEALRSRAPARSRLFAWSAAAACAVGVLAVGLQWRQADTAIAPAAPTQTVAASADYEDNAAALDESPEFYLWLASSDAQALAME